MLLLLLFRFTIFNVNIESKIERASHYLLQKQKMQTKLESIFTNIEPPTHEPSFYTQKFPDDPLIQSLIVQFRTEIDPDPLFSGVNLGRIYLNEKSELCFTQWPLTAEKHRTEVLCKEIRHLEWEFLGPKREADPHFKPVTKQLSYLSIWPKDQKSYPQVIRLKLWQGVDKKKGNPPNMQFAFVLPIQEPIQLKK